MAGKTLKIETDNESHNIDQEKSGCYRPAGAGEVDPLEEAGSFATLYAAHQRALLKYASSLVRDRSVAEDIVQEAWLRFARAAADTQPSEPLRYLYRIVRNLSIDKGRREVREQEIFDTASPEHLADNVADTNPAADQIAWDKSALDAVRVVISAMPPRMRIAFEMHRFGGCKLREIAEHLNISLAMAHTLVAAAVDRCREYVEWP